MHWYFFVQKCFFFLSYSYEYFKLLEGDIIILVWTPHFRLMRFPLEWRARFYFEKLIFI